MQHHMHSTLDCPASQFEAHSYSQSGIAATASDDFLDFFTSTGALNIPGFVLSGTFQTSALPASPAPIPAAYTTDVVDVGYEDPRSLEVPDRAWFTYQQTEDTSQSQAEPHVVQDFESVLRQQAVEVSWPIGACPTDAAPHDDETVVGSSSSTPQPQIARSPKSPKGSQARFGSWRYRHTSKKFQGRAPVQNCCAEKHALHRPSDWAVYCRWTKPGDDGTREVCGDLVKLRHLEEHIHAHGEQEAGDAARSEKCKMFLKDGKTLCNKPCCGKFKRHVLSSGKRHAGPIQGARVLEDGQHGQKVDLPLMTCRHCQRTFSMYVGGHVTSLQRHVKKEHGIKA